MRPGEHIGEYVLMERMGEGGFGEVWRAENADLPGRAVAIKIAKDPSYVSALRHEAQLLHRLDHANVVRLLTIHASSEPPYLVVEYVRGESLRQVLDRQRKMEVEPAVSLVLDVLAGLQAAHAAGLVHRDVKPSNVLIGPDGRPKLADFGLGRAVRSSADSVQVSVQGTMPAVVGTLDYMSPEQRRGEEGDARSDLYACGVLLYEVIAGVARPVRLPIPGAPGALTRVVERALAVEPSARFASAAAMAAALRSSVLLPEAPAAPRSAPPQEPVRGRYPSPASFHLVPFLILGAIILVSVMFVSYALKPTAPAVQPAPTRAPLVVPSISDPAADLQRAPSLVILPTALRHRGSIDALSFSPDGRMLATASSDGTVRLWSAPEGDLVQTLDLGAPAVTVVFSRDGKRLAAGGGKGKARLWTLGSRDGGQDIQGDIVDLLAMAFAEDDGTILTVDRGGQVRAWDIGEREVTSTTLTRTGLEACIIATDARSLVALVGGAAEVRSIPSGNMSWSIPMDAGKPFLAAGPDGRRLALGNSGRGDTRDGRVHIWSLQEKKFERTLPADGPPATAVAISSGGDLAVVADGGDFVRLWSLLDGQPLDAGQATTIPVSVLALGPDSSLLALGGAEGARLAVLHHGPEPDWGEPPKTVGGIPRLAGDVSAPLQVRAGDTLSIVVQVRNSGAGGSSQLWARLETDDPRIGAACMFGAVPMGQTFSRTLVVRIPVERVARPVTGCVRFFDPEGFAPGPIDVRFEVTSGR
ncbi:MAG: serine/threonine-protein kinase [Planctomycetota bacterium]